MTDITYPDVTVQLSGRDGNAFAILAATKTAIEQQVGKEEAKAYIAEAMSQESYDELIRYTMRTVVVV